MKPIPSVVIQPPAPGTPITVTFDLDTLVSIETACSMGINEVCENIQLCLGVEKPGDAGKKPPAEPVKPRSTGLNLGFMTRFVSGCTKIPVPQCGTKFGLNGLMPAFTSLLPEFVAAVNMLGGTPEEDGGTEAHPHLAAVSDASESGPASTSV